MMSDFAKIMLIGQVFFWLGAVCLLVVTVNLKIANESLLTQNTVLLDTCTLITSEAKDAQKHARDALVLVAEYEQMIQDMLDMGYRRKVDE